MYDQYNNAYKYDYQEIILNIYAIWIQMNIINDTFYLSQNNHMSLHLIRDDPHEFHN